jgi:hypothetical protein
MQWAARSFLLEHGQETAAWRMTRLVLLRRGKQGESGTGALRMYSLRSGLPPAPDSAGARGWFQ